MQTAVNLAVVLVILLVVCVFILHCIFGAPMSVTLVVWGVIGAVVTGTVWRSGNKNVG
jgi:hypothetical protein